MLEVTETKNAISKAQEALNTQIDASFQARRLNVVRTLDLASKALERASAHLDTAAEQEAKKNAAPAGE